MSPQSTRSSKSSHSHEFSYEAPPRSDSRERPSLPNGTTAFEHAIRPFLTQYAGHQHFPQFRFATDPSTTSTSLRSVPPRHVPKHSSSESAQEETNEVDGSGEVVPTHLKKHNAFPTRLRLVQLRTLLLRCTVLQSTVREIERKAWFQAGEYNPHWHYSQIQQLARQARAYAEELGSRDLQARCEYWAGRGYGGTGDYGAAAEHFSMAMKLDIPNDVYRDGSVKLRGLTPREKEDVHFLYRSVLKRQRKLQQKIEKAINRTQSHSTRSVPTALSLEKGMRLNPPWMPDRDRIMAIAKSTYMEKQKMKIRQNGRDDSELSQSARASRSSSISGIPTEHNAARRLLDHAEWQYIRGEVPDGLSRQQTGVSIEPSPNLQPSSPRPQSRGTILNNPSSWSIPPSTYFAQRTASSSVIPDLDAELWRAGFYEEPLSPFEDRPRSPPLPVTARHSFELSPISIQRTDT